jgi:hypothetical protein
MNAVSTGTFIPWVTLKYICCTPNTGIARTPAAKHVKREHTPSSAAADAATSSAWPTPAHGKSAGM